MDRIQEILGFQRPVDTTDTFGVESALCACLEPDESCELLQLAAIDRPDLRAGILKKVCADIDRAQLACHESAIAKLMDQLLVSNSRERQSLGYCLSQLSLHVDASLRRSIQKFFLSSCYISVRRRGYKSIGANIEDLVPEICLAWNQFFDFFDPECAWIITKAFPVDFLIANRSLLSGKFSEDWQFSRLYLRIGEKNPELVEELRAVNEISYCYVLAKLGKVLSLEEAKSIVTRTSTDEKFGLLVWSFGQMKLWAVLKYIEAELVGINAARTAALCATFGIQPHVPAAASYP